ncbi:hotdog family protein [Anaerosinus massiliensis]|uniref:hypothetical protein n=1 Tax=Massilibacillus massiliensis TaxID=1806837 RepID=UPI000DA60A9C|nr:hypothetical protein [Massilibacillus massiliensis]
MIQLAKAFSQLKDEKYHNSYIAKVNYQRYAENRTTVPQVAVEKETSRFQVLSAAVYDAKQQLIAKLSMTLFLHVTIQSLDEKSGVPDKAVAWKTFHKREIYDFSQRVGDINTIHLTERPVVQGLLILETIAQYFTAFREIEIKFMKPIYAEDPVYLESTETGMIGYSDNAKVFQAIIK